jgi:hypothetical protein
MSHSGSTAVRVISKKGQVQPQEATVAADERESEVNYRNIGGSFVRDEPITNKVGYGPRDGNDLVGWPGPHNLAAGWALPLGSESINLRTGRGYVWRLFFHSFPSLYQGTLGRIVGLSKVFLAAWDSESGSA